MPGETIGTLLKIDNNHLQTTYNTAIESVNESFQMLQTELLSMQTDLPEIATAANSFLSELHVRQQKSIEFIQKLNQELSEEFNRVPNSNEQWGIRNKARMLIEKYTSLEGEIKKIIDANSANYDASSQKFIEKFKEIGSDTQLKAEERLKEWNKTLYKFKEQQEVQLSQYLSVIKDAHFNLTGFELKPESDPTPKSVIGSRDGEVKLTAVKSAKPTIPEDEPVEDEDKTKAKTNTFEFNFIKEKYSDKQKEIILINGAKKIRADDLIKREDEIKELKKQGKDADIAKLPPLTIEISAKVSDRRRLIANTAERYGRLTEDAQQAKTLLSMEWRACIQAGYKTDAIKCPKNFGPSEEDLTFAHKFEAKESYQPLAKHAAAYSKLVNNAERNKYVGNIPILSNAAANNIGKKLSEFEEDITPKNLAKLQEELKSIDENAAGLILGQHMESMQESGKPGANYKAAAKIMRDLRAETITDPQLRIFLKGINAENSKKHSSSLKTILAHISTAFTELKNKISAKTPDFLIDHLSKNEIEKINAAIAMKASHESHVPSVELSDADIDSILRNNLSEENFALYEKYQAIKEVNMIDLELSEEATFELAKNEDGEAAHKNENNAAEKIEKNEKQQEEEEDNAETEEDSPKPGK